MIQSMPHKCIYVNSSWSTHELLSCSSQCSAIDGANKDDGMYYLLCVMEHNKYPFLLTGMSKE